MPELTVNMIEGRTLEQKRELARRLSEVVVEVLKVDPSSVLVTFYENRREDKAKRSNNGENSHVSLPSMPRLHYRTRSAIG